MPESKSERWGRKRRVWQTRRQRAEALIDCTLKSRFSIPVDFLSGAGSLTIWWCGTKTICILYSFFMVKLEDSLMKAEHFAILEMWNQFGVSLPNGEDRIFLSSWFFFLNLQLIIKSITYWSQKALVSLTQWRHGRGPCSRDAVQLIITTRPADW